MLVTRFNDTAHAAQAYIALGWAVVPLHDVAGGMCSCEKGTDTDHSMTQGGKHPLWGGWQNAGIRDAAVAASVWTGRPQANLGIVTGRASGVWVLDVDPDHGGDQRLVELVSANGALPETWIVQTGSGGRHYYFTMPDFDFTTSRGRLPVGLDVRGNRGQVVAPPSFTLKGEYRVLSPVAPVPAPAWLLDLIRPSAPPPGAESAGAIDGRWDGSVRGSEYARAAVRALLAELAGALPGSRNDTAYRVGRRLAELVNSPWAGLDGNEVAAGYMAAALACDIDGGFPQAEAEDVLRKAVRAQGGRGVDMPAADFYGTVWQAPVFPPGMSGMPNIDTSNNPGGGQSDFDQAGQGPATGPFTSPGMTASTPVATELINGYVEQPRLVDPWEDAVGKELSRLLVREEALRRSQDYRAVQSPIQIMDREALRAMPRSEPLIAGWLGRGQTARLYGPPGSGKSFAAIDMAACIADGRPWNGYRTAQGEVIYFAVEDAEGVALRLRAWEMHHQTEHRVHVVSTAIQMNQASVARVLAAVRAYFDERRIALIVLDTQAMVTIGLDENSVQDMGVFVEAVKLLASQTGAAVLTVHHSGVKGGRARGSSSVRGAMDVEIEAAMTGVTCTLSSTKQKNVADPPAIMATLNVLDIGELDALGQPVTSCVLLGPGADSGPFTHPAGPQLSPLHKRALAIATALVETAATGETYSRLRIRAANVTDFGKTPGSVTAAFSKAFAFLVERGRIAKAQGREAYYFIEVEGEDRLAPNPGKMVTGGPEVYDGT